LLIGKLCLKKGNYISPFFPAANRVSARQPLIDGKTIGYIDDHAELGTVNIHE
jgi:hypothetical protein